MDKDYTDRINSKIRESNDEQSFNDVNIQKIKTEKIPIRKKLIIIISIAVVIVIVGTLVVIEHEENRAAVAFNIVDSSKKNFSADIKEGDFLEQIEIADSILKQYYELTPDSLVCVDELSLDSDYSINNLVFNFEVETESAKDIYSCSIQDNLLHVNVLDGTTNYIMTTTCAEFTDLLNSMDLQFISSCGDTFANYDYIGFERISKTAVFDRIKNVYYIENNELKHSDNIEIFNDSVAFILGGEAEDSYLAVVPDESMQNKEIADNTYSNEDLGDVVMPANICSIGENTFSFSLINSLEIENGSILESIGDNSFAINNIQTLSLPDTINFIGAMAFCGNPLQKVRIEAMEPVIACNAFGAAGTVFECYKGSTVEAFVLNNALCIEAGNTVEYIDKDSNTKMIDASDWNNYAYVVDGTLKYCSWVPGDTLEISDDVEIISDSLLFSYPFSNLIIPESVTRIGNSAFYSTGISSLVIEGNGLEVIEDFAFWDTNLTEVSLPASVKKIGIDAFDFSEIKKIRIESMDAEIDMVSQYDADDNVVIECYKGSTAEQYVADMAEMGYPITVSYIK